jgi:hypothetical protein
MNAPDALTAKYRHAVRLIEAQRKILIDAGGQSEVLDAYAHIVRHLNRIPAKEIAKVMGVKAEVRETVPQIPPEVARRMSHSELQVLISNPTTTRKLLESIAVYRFGVPKGSMRSFGNIATLKEKLKTLMDNERSHEIISSIANRSVTYSSD